MLNEMPLYKNYEIYFEGKNKIRVICSDFIGEERVKIKNIENIVLDYAKQIKKCVKFNFLDFSKVEKTYRFCLKNFKKQPRILSYFYDLALIKNCNNNKLFLQLYIKLHIINHDDLIRDIVSSFEAVDNDYDTFFTEIINYLNNYFDDRLQYKYNKYFKSGVEKNNIYFTKYINNLLYLNPIYIKEIINEVDLEKCIISFLSKYGCPLSLDYSNKMRYLNSIDGYIGSYKDFVLLQEQILNIPLIIYQTQKLYDSIKIQKDTRQSRKTNDKIQTNNKNIEKVVKQFNCFKIYLKTILELYNYIDYSLSISYKVKEIKKIDDWAYDYPYYSGFKIKEEKHYNDLMMFAFDTLIQKCSESNPFIQKRECERCHISEDEAEELKDKRRVYCYGCASIIKREKAKMRQRKHRQKS